MTHPVLGIHILRFVLGVASAVAVTLSATGLVRWSGLGYPAVFSDPGGCSIGDDVRCTRPLAESSPFTCVTRCDLWEPLAFCQDGDVPYFTNDIWTCLGGLESPENFETHVAVDSSQEATLDALVSSHNALGADQAELLARLAVVEAAVATLSQRVTAQEVERQPETPAIADIWRTALFGDQYLIDYSSSGLEPEFSGINAWGAHAAQAVWKNGMGMLHRQGSSVDNSNGLKFARCVPDLFLSSTSGTTGAWGPFCEDMQTLMARDDFGVTHSMLLQQSGGADTLVVFAGYNDAIYGWGTDATQSKDAFASWLRAAKYARARAAVPDSVWSYPSTHSGLQGEALFPRIVGGYPSHDVTNIEPGQFYILSSTSTSGPLTNNDDILINGDPYPFTIPDASGSSRVINMATIPLNVSSTFNITINGDGNTDQSVVTLIRKDESLALNIYVLLPPAQDGGSAAIDAMRTGMREANTENPGLFCLVDLDNVIPSGSYLVSGSQFPGLAGQRAIVRLLHQTKIDDTSICE